MRALFTYEPKRHSWTEVIVEPERTATVFRGAGSNPNHVVYRSIYPDASMTDIFDRKSPTEIYAALYAERPAARP